MELNEYIQSLPLDDDTKNQVHVFMINKLIESKIVTLSALKGRFGPQADETINERIEILNMLQSGTNA